MPRWCAGKSQLETREVREKDFFLRSGGRRTSGRGGWMGSSPRERGGVGGPWKGTTWRGRGTSSGKEAFDSGAGLVVWGAVGVTGERRRSGLRRSAKDGAEEGNAGMAGMAGTAGKGFGTATSQHGLLTWSGSYTMRQGDVHVCIWAAIECDVDGREPRYTLCRSITSSIMSCSRSFSSSASAMRSFK